MQNTTGGKSFSKPAASSSTHLLKIKDGDNFNIIYGLTCFNNDDGSSTYKVTRGETPSLDYAVFQNLEKTSESGPDFVLKARDAGTGKFSVRITGLWANKTKAGDDYLNGTQKEGDHAGAYYIFSAKKAA